MKGKQGENKKKEQVKISVRDSIAATVSRNKNEMNVITDTRFSSVHHDPRFQEVPNHHSKVLIDKRFSPVLKKNFSPSKSRVDKRGKRIYVNPENRLHQYYRLDEEEENKKKIDQESDEDDENRESEKNEKAKVQKLDNNILESDSNSESEELEADELSDDTSSLTGSGTDEDDGGYLEDEPEEPEENIPVIEQETRRLAIVNMDWSRVRKVKLRPQAQLASENRPGKTVKDNLICEGMLSSSKKEKFKLSSLVRSIKRSLNKPKYCLLINVLENDNGNNGLPFMVPSIKIKH